MITPLFKITQDENYIIITAKLKYVKFSDFDYFIENNNFRFSLKPYILNIYLSHSLNPISVNNSFKYDIDTQLLICKIEKNDHGVYFENLDLLSTLFENKTSSTSTNCNINLNKIEEIANGNEVVNICHIKANTEDELNQYLFDIYSIVEEDNCNVLNINNKEQYLYGFNRGFSDVFNKRAEDAMEVSDLNPKKIPHKLRYLAKLEREMHEFVPERYACDRYLDGEIEELFNDQFKIIISLSNNSFIQSLINKKDSPEIPYNEKELQILKDINKTKLSFISSSTFCPFKFYLQIIDVLFAYIYDLITTEYEHSSESGWCINKLSSTLSCHIDYDRNFYSQSKEIDFNILSELIKHLIISCYRRVLIYPLYRNLKLCDKVKKEVCDVIKLGRFAIVKCLLQIRIIFEKNQPRYLLNILYIDPFLKWVQFYSEDKLFILLSDITSKTNINKSDLKLDLDKAEKDFDECDEEEEEEI